MKKLLILVCVLALLLSLTGIASASPAQPWKFRIKGYTTYVDPSGYPYVVGLQSAGKVIQHIQGTFTMDEDLFFVLVNGIPIPTSNSGDLTITTKKGDTVAIGFAGGTDGATVWGDFWVKYGTGAYAGLMGGGTYVGIADSCTYDPVTFQPIECAGFYADFTFNDQ